MARPVEYDRNTVVARATDMFWTRGYGRTSVSDLVAATGLQPGSLYAAFGNKKGLFLEVIDAYNQAFIARVRALRDEDARALDKIGGLLADIVDDADSARGKRGCLTVNALLELSVHDDDIATRLCTYNAELRKALAWLVRDAQAEGDVDSAQDPNELASFVVSNLWGMRVMCKSRPDRASLEAIVNGVLSALRR